MAREVYLRGESDEVQSEPIVADTPKKRWDNWWYYHYKIVIGSVIFGAIVIAYIFSLVSTVDADYTIAYMGTTWIDDKSMEDFRDQLAHFGEDLNGDGRVVISFNTMYIGQTETDGSTDKQYFEASVVKSISDLSTADSIIWMIDEDGYNRIIQGTENLFSDISEEENPEMMRLSELAGFKAMVLESKHEDFTDEEYINMTFGEYYLSIRDLEGIYNKDDPNKIAYVEANQRMLENLINNKREY